MAIMDHWTCGVVKSCNRNRVKIGSYETGTRDRININKTFGKFALEALSKLPADNEAPDFTVFAGIEIYLPDFYLLAHAATETTKVLVKDFQSRQAHMQHKSMMRAQCKSKQGSISKRARARRRRNKRKAGPHTASDPTTKRR